MPSYLNVVKVHTRVQKALKLNGGGEDRQGDKNHS